jgi:indoleacetamide hydrolase
LRDFSPSEDAPVVEALRAAGALVLGKTNLHELSYGWTSNNQAFGAVHNPYDPARIPGGSSGGTAAAVAARLRTRSVWPRTPKVRFACRPHSAVSPDFGRRPGATRRKACIPISPLFDQVGPLARRRVVDLACCSTRSSPKRSSAPSQHHGHCAACASASCATIGTRGSTRGRASDRSCARASSSEAGVQLVESELPGLAELIERTTAQVQNHDVRIALAHYLAEFATGRDFDTVVAMASADLQVAVSRARLARRRRIRVRGRLRSRSRPAPAGAAAAVPRVFRAHRRRGDRVSDDADRGTTRSARTACS